MKKIIILLITLTIVGLNSNCQKVKYKTEVEPILKGAYSIYSVSKLEKFYKQTVPKNGKLTADALKLSGDKLTAVCYFLGHSYEENAIKNKEYPTTDSAIADLNSAIEWYKKLSTVLNVKNDTLANHITQLEAHKKQWLIDQEVVKGKIVELKESTKSYILQVETLNADKATALRTKLDKALFLNEFKEVNFESKETLSDLERELKIKEDDARAANERKQFLMQQMEKEKNQKEFLRLQEVCKSENTCPNCPIEVATKFRDAYYSGDIATIKDLIIDYYGDEKLFYEKDINIFKTLTEEETTALSLQFKAQTADFKKTNPDNVVYYSDNEEKDFFIDKNYKANFLHATVFKAVNDFDKVDLIKYQGKWKVYRVGGAYGGRTGATITSGKFFFDPKFLLKEVKMKKKK